MKFLCPSCKAKYQIADEKVIGRSVKMKCRQCGHVIEIQEAVVGASAGGVSQPPIALNSIPAPALAPPPKPAKPPAERLGHSPPPDAVGVKPARPGRPGFSESHEPTHSAESAPQFSRNLRAPVPKSAPSARSPASASPRPASSPSTQPLPKVAGPGFEKARPPARAAEQSAPRPDAAHPHAVGQAAAPSGLDALRSIGVGKHAPLSTDPPMPTAAEVSHGSPLAPTVGHVVSQTPRRSGVALAEAFTSAVGVAKAVGEPLVGDEWFVGVDDNPIGPIPLTDLRARAARGQVTVDSLVWRDGFEDWKPVRSFPELLAVVEEAISSVSASRAPIPASRSQSADFGPVVTLSQPTERQLHAAPGVMAGSSDAAVGSTPSQRVLVASPVLTPEELAAATGRSHHRTPAGVWIAVSGAVALGLAIGFVLFRPTPAPPVIKYVQVAASAGAPSATVASNPSAEPQEAPIIASAESISGKVRRSASGETKPNVDTNAQAKTSTGLAGLQDLRTVGPRSGPGETSSNSGQSGGQGLDSATLQKTVSRYTASVRRSCWQPALDSRAPDAPTSARVSVKIDVSPNGNVSAASSSGDPKGYRGLASCIESRVRNWTFPPSSGSTTVNVPFVFAAQ